MPIPDLSPLQIYYSYNQIAERKKNAVITSVRTSSFSTLNRKTLSLARGELPPTVKNRIIMKFIS